MCNPSPHRIMVAMVNKPSGVNPPAIQVRGLSKSFGDRLVLRDLDLEVSQGSFLALFGANGAGKTTLLRILSGQARADAGSVMVAGCSLPKHATTVRRRIGVVSHRGLLYDDLTCLENLVFYGRLFSLSDPVAQARQTLQRLALDSHASQRVRTLSHGQQKRLAIARAILHRPVLLLLDEPEAGLDRDSVNLLEGLLKDWTAQGGTVVMTTHDQARGAAWAHRAVVLADGHIHEQDAVQVERRS
ncbi:MAG: heme ABC exporter ATP-binding protein CcmA [SAR202 cluster bacterium]|nr:heme ABC exporter ATP-binding protein CcmA [SAR202 cluster bacterium]